jgi:hypothetical protein
VPDEWKDMLVYNAVHLRVGEVFKSRPAQICIGLAALVLAVGEDAPLNWLAKRCRLALLQLLHLVKALDENEIGDLLDYLEWIGEPA